MANLPESASFDAGVYQIETTDAVIGGVNGISNLAAKNLANRTTWLKQQVDALNLLKGKGTPIFSTGSSYAGGDQVIHLKNIWQANTSITPGAFNEANWTKQLGAAAESALAATVPLMSGTAAVGTSTDLARKDHVHPSDTSRVVKAGDTMTGQLVIAQNGTLDDLNTCAMQIQALNDAIIWFHRPGFFSVALGVDANNNLVYGGAGSTLAAVHQVFHDGNCPKSLGNNGYQKLASGLIIQWGTVAGGSLNTNISYPVTFPNSMLTILATDVAATNATAAIGVSNSLFKLLNAGSNTTQWLAVGY